MSAGERKGFVGTGMDVTEQEQLTEALRKSEMELRQLLEFTPQLVAVFGPGRERLHANRVALEYLGVSLDEWRQASTGYELHSEDAERFKAASEWFTSNRSAYEVEVRLRRYDGTYRWFLARYNPVSDDHQQIIRWYVPCTDIEELKRTEDRLQQENIALREDIDQASNVRRDRRRVARADHRAVACVQGRRQRLDGAAHRRNGHRQRTRRAGDSQTVPTRLESLRGRELCGHSAGADSLRTVRP